MFGLKDMSNKMLLCRDGFRFKATKNKWSMKPHYHVKVFDWNLDEFLLLKYENSNDGQHNYDNVPIKVIEELIKKHCDLVF